jgi:hypothetical protein
MNDSKKSFAYRAQLALGRGIRKQLDPLRTQTEVGVTLGMSQQLVDRVEVIALAKLAKKIMELRSRGEI